MGGRPAVAAGAGLVPGAGWTARVYAFFRRWREHGPIAEFHDRLRGTVREHEGREAEPTAGIIDAQSVRAAATVPGAVWAGGVADAYTACGSVEQGRQLEGADLGVGRARLLPSTISVTIPADRTTP
ncbi:hypothetical protein ACWEPM_24575 [Streptomyces sp. NPDC004244]